MRIPTDAATGAAKVTVSYTSLKNKHITPATFDFNIAPTAEEIAAKQRLQQRIQDIERQLAESERLARTADLLKKGYRPPVQASRNCDEFKPVSAGFVRFTILATAGNMEPCLDEVEVFGPEGNDNLARVKGASVRASSTIPGHAIHQVHHLTDGRFGNHASWISNERGQGWVEIQLATETKVARVHWSRDATTPTQFHDRVPERYRIDVSTDGRAWTTVSTHEDRITAQSLATAIPQWTPEQLREREELTNELKKLRQP